MAYSKFISWQITYLTWIHTWHSRTAVAIKCDLSLLLLATLSQLLILCPQLLVLNPEVSDDPKIPIHRRVCFPDEIRERTTRAARHGGWWWRSWSDMWWWRSWSDMWWWRSWSDISVQGSITSHHRCHGRCSWASLHWRLCHGRGFWASLHWRLKWFNMMWFQSGRIRRGMWAFTQCLAWYLSSSRLCGWGFVLHRLLKSFNWGFFSLCEKVLSHCLACFLGSWHFCRLVLGSSFFTTRILHWLPFFTWLYYDSHSRCWLS